MTRSEIKKFLEIKLKALPVHPGCYIFKDYQKEILYVGKALSLRSRVRSYFQSSSQHTARIQRMVSRIRDIEWIIVDSEVEALVLECNLIKKHLPPYNVRLRDDKNYPYIVITKEAYPRVFYTRHKRSNGGQYFGPFTNARSVRDTLALLHKIFPLIPCGKSWKGTPDQRPCLYYHMDQCLAPCAGLSDRKAYQKVLDQVGGLISGKENTLINEIKKSMVEASKKEEFEQAAKFRDRLFALENILQKQKVISEDLHDRDVIAVVQDERGSAIQMLYVRGGKLMGQRHFFLDGTQDVTISDSIQQFVKQYYSDSPEVPEEILLPVEIQERKVVEQWLRTKRGKVVTVQIPKGGTKVHLMEMAARNAESALENFKLEMEKKEVWSENALNELQEILDLGVPPLRIEGYDISNIQGTSPVGSMVVMQDAVPAKEHYRRFKIKYHLHQPNDFAMMHEVLTRRLKALLEGDTKFNKMPDLIVIDGGKGQLSAALRARDALKLEIPMIGLAKKQELLVVPNRIKNSGRNFIPEEIYSYPEEGIFDYNYDLVELSLSSPGLTLLRRLRDEAHRFAIAYHRKVRQKGSVVSVLDEIPGIGPKRRRMLLRTFGSVEKIRHTSLSNLASIPTMTQKLAEQILLVLSKNHLLIQESSDKE